MQAQSHKIVICGGSRTPIGHISKSLSGLNAVELMITAAENAIAAAGAPKDQIDGLIAGWVGQDFNAPNLARVTLLRAGLPQKAQAVTVQNNCISSIESVCAAARFILAGEGELYVAGGTEAMTRLPYSIAGSRANKALRSLDTVKKGWGELLEAEGVRVVDAMEQGLTDPVKDINMAATAEVCAQMRGITREAQDAFAGESFKRSIDGWNKGFYQDHVPPIRKNGETVLDKDEYCHLRADLAAKPKKFAKAPVFFDNRVYPLKDFYRDYSKHMNGHAHKEGSVGTVTLFNSCGRSDGGAAVIVASEEKAKALNLPIMAEIKGWGFYGNDPAHMGVSPALAAPVALKHAGIEFDALDQIELHEPFAATVLGIFKDGKEKFGHDWEAKHQSGALNPNGGSLSLGHPLGATGTRLLLNLLYALKANPKGRHGMIAGCAGGGMGGALVIEKRD